MDAIMEMFSGVIGDIDLTQITEIFQQLIDYITNLISSLM